MLSIYFTHGTCVIPLNSSNRFALGERPLDDDVIAKVCPALATLIAKLDADILTSAFSLAISVKLGLQNIRNISNAHAVKELITLYVYNNSNSFDSLLCSN